MPPSYCSVQGCSNSRSPTCSLYCFPKDALICKKWVDFCNRPELYKKYDENGPEYLYKSSRICSDHFQPNDFNNPNLYSQGLKKGSIPTVNPASKEPKSASSPLNGVTTVTGNGGGGGGGGSGSSNGTGSPIDEKLLTAAVASMAAGGTQLPTADHLSLFYAAAIAAAAQAQAANHSVPLNLKRTAPPSAAVATNNNNNTNSSSGNNNLQSSGVTSATSTTTTTASTTPPAATGGAGGPVSAKRNRAVPPLATPTGALANLIQRQQQIKEQQRKAAAAAAAVLASANQVSITPTSGGGGVTTSAARAPHSLVPISSITTTTTTTPSNGGAAPPPSKRPTLNNNNNNVSNNNHNHNHHHNQSQKPSSLLGKRSSREDNGSGSEYGINMMDIDMLSGAESSEGDSSNGPASADEEYAAYRRQLKKVTRKVEEVIPLALKSQLTVTPAAAANLGSNVSSTTTTASSPNNRTINNNSIHNVNANGGGVGVGGAVSPIGKDGLVDYKQKYELTLKELFACRKIVKNQNKAMKQLQGEIDFLNLLLKEK